MSVETKLIPTSSQTVGPYFRIGMEYLCACAPPVSSETATCITIRGRVLDRDGAPVPDALLEFWSSPANARNSCPDSNPAELSEGFRRAATDPGGGFSVALPRPQPVPLEDGAMQAPHLLVLVFARGLLRNLISRVYLDDEPGNLADPVLLTIPAQRRPTLIARRDGENSFRWDVRLQGDDETVFFAW